MVVSEEIWIGAELDFIEQDVVISLANDVDEKLLAGVRDIEVDIEPEIFELGF